MLAQHDVDSMPGLSSSFDRNDFLEPMWQWKNPRKLSAVEVERMKTADLYMVHSVEFELTSGDTLVFVDLPNVPSGTRKLLDCDSIAYRSLPFRVHSDKLRATGSAVFDEMLGPTNQFRVQRRRKLVNKLPEDVKYVLDLTPPTEGDDLVFQMTEISLTPGIMRWWTSYLMHEVDRALVIGHDDVCCCKRSSVRKVSQGDDGIENSAPFNTLGTDIRLPPRPPTVLVMKQRGDDKLYETPEYRRIPDYCPVRHRNAIVRLLVHIEGRGIALDSAPRVWTLLGVAKVLDCTSAVRDEIAQWLMASPNSEFIEVLPEEAIQMGYALQLADITRSAFRILVNEMALTEAAPSSSDGPNTKQRTTIFGRRTGDVSDELSNLIEHAARAMVERMMHVKHQFSAVLDYWGVSQWMKLQRLEAAISKCFRGSSQRSDPESVAFGVCGGLVREVVLEVSNCIHSSLQCSLSESSTPSHYFEGIDKDRATYVLPSDFKEFFEIYGKFNEIQRLMCPFIYKELHARIMNPLSTNKKRKGDTPVYPLLVYKLDNLEYALENLVRRTPSQFLDDDWDEFLRRTPDKDGSFTFLWRRPLVDFTAMDSEITAAFVPLSNSWLRHDIEPMLNLTRHMLLTLDSNELKYLPLWAGGLNDGTGGVFEEPIPSTDMGPSGPGPAFHTGQTLPSAPPSLSGSLMEDMGAMNVRGSDTSGSVDVHDSVSTVYRSDRVIADDVSVATEAFDASDNDYAAARFAVPSEQQEMGQTIDDMVDSGTERGDDDDYTLDNDTPQVSDGGSDDLVDVEKELREE